MRFRPTGRGLLAMVVLATVLLPATAANAAPADPVPAESVPSAAAPAADLQGDGLIALRVGGLFAEDLEEDSNTGDGDEVRVLVNDTRVWPVNDGAYDIGRPRTCVRFVEPWVEGNGSCGDRTEKGGGHLVMFFQVGERVTVKIEEDDLVGDDDLGSATVTVDGTRQAFTASRRDGQWPDTVSYSVSAQLVPVTQQTVYNWNSGRCLEIKESSDANGAAALLWSCVGQDGARWNFQRAGNSGEVLIRRAGNGKCLEIANSKDDNGVIAQQWDCVGQDGIRWKVVSVNSEAYYIVNESGKCLEVQNSSVNDGARIQQWSCVGQPGALWGRY